MKPVKFVTTFSKYGYLVYGQQWIASFLTMTADYPNITAKIYIDGATEEERRLMSVSDKLEVVDYYQAIPEHRSWLGTFDRVSRHSDHVKKLCKKFSFKSFVIFTALETVTEGYVIWLDADCIFKNSDYDNFPESILDDKFIACQIEAGSNHVESGFLAFDIAHPDKQKFINTMKSFYFVEANINSFGELYDGFVIYRTLDHTQIDRVDLNLGYGLGGVQSDPNCTFLNPVVGERFYHNIGITGKRNYASWKTYARHDQYFKVIHGIDPSELGERHVEKINKINQRVRAKARGR